MIIHVALYGFRADATEKQIAAGIRDLQISTTETGLADWYISGRHLALPADQAIQDMVYDFAALWGFANQQALDNFSRHPIMAQCVARSIRPLLGKLAITNFFDLSDASWQPTGRGEHERVS